MTIGLVFFDSSILIEVEEKMVEKLDWDGQDEDDEVVAQNGYRVIAKPEEILGTYKTKKLSYFVTRNTLNFFERFSIPADFLSHPIEEWNSLDSYQKTSLLHKVFFLFLEFRFL